MSEQKTLEDYHGSAPNFTGGEDAVSYVRQIRSGETDAAELARLKAIEAAAAAYHRACLGVETAYYADGDTWGDRMSDAMQARQEASDALCAAVAEGRE